MTEDNPAKRTPIKDLRQEPGGDTTVEMEALHQLPLGRRYEWRAAWATYLSSTIIIE
jgi:hypothetical protein